VVKGSTRKARWLKDDKANRGEDYDSLAVHPSDRPAWIALSHPIAVGNHTTRNGHYTTEDLLPARIYPDALEPEFAIPPDQGGAEPIT